MDREGETVIYALKDIMCTLQEIQHVRPDREEAGRWQIKFILHSCLHHGKGNGSEGGNHRDLTSVPSAGALDNLCPIRISRAWRAGSEILQECYSINFASGLSPD